MTISPVRGNASVLSEVVALAGLRVLDVGCGDGALARMMSRAGAHVTGLEPNPVQLARARAAPPEGNETYRDGSAAALPFGGETFSLVVFFNSLHHVPVSEQFRTLTEAARVTRRGGTVYVSEPLAQGPFFELMRPVHDETRVRAAAQEALKRAPEIGLEPLAEIHHLNPIRHANYEEFRSRIVAVNPETAPRFEAHDAVMRAAFARLGTDDGGPRLFLQPMQVNVLTKK